MEESEQTTPIVWNNNQMPTCQAFLPREERIKYYHNLALHAASVAKFAALACGIELIRAKEDLPKMKFSRFVETNCAFSKKTAYRYMALAGFAFGHNEQLLIESPKAADDLAMKADAALDGKSLKDIYIEAGIIKPSASQGGARAGAGRPKKEHDLAAELRELEESPAENLAIADELFTRLMQWGIAEQGIAKLPPKALPQMLAYLRQLTAEVTKRIEVA